MTRVPVVRVPYRFALALALVTGATGFATASRCLAADGTATTTTSATSTTSAASTEISAQAQAQAKAALAQQIATRAAAANPAEVEKITSKMVAAAHKVDTDASADADAKIAGRMATEFHMDATALATEKQSLDISWGNLMIAHTLSASASDATSASVANLVSLHKDGMGWGKLAAGLGFKLGQAASAIEAEGRVAGGQAEASGKVAHIAMVSVHTGDPDAAGADGAAASAANHAGSAAQHAADGAANAASRAANAAAHADAGLHVGDAGGK